MNTSEFSQTLSSFRISLAMETRRSHFVQSRTSPQQLGTEESGYCRELAVTALPNS